MASNARLERAEELLEAAYLVLNLIPNHTLDHPQYKDTYTLARDISKFFKDAEEGAYRGD